MSMKEYTVVVRTDDHGGRIIEVQGLVLFTELDEIKKALGNIYVLPLNEEIKVKI